MHASLLCLSRPSPHPLGVLARVMDASKHRRGQPHGWWWAYVTTTKVTMTTVHKSCSDCSEDNTHPSEGEGGREEEGGTCAASQGEGEGETLGAVP